MYIASAVYYSKEFKATRLKICTADEADCFQKKSNPDKGVICLRYDNDLCETIMNLAAQKSLPVDFEYRGDSCKLISYVFNDAERFYNKYRVSYISEKVKLPYQEEIVVYTGRCNCPKCYGQYGFESIENVCGTVSLEKDHNARVNIDVQRCRHCLKYFIDKQSLLRYEKRYGRLYIRRCTMAQYVQRPSPWSENDFAPDSILSRNGYYAKYPKEVRRRALEGMMMNGVKKAEIKHKLTEFIELRGERCYIAAPIWKADLEFVNDYRLEDEEKVFFS